MALMSVEDAVEVEKAPAPLRPLTQAHSRADELSKSSYLISLLGDGHFRHMSKIHITQTAQPHGLSD